MVNPDSSDMKVEKTTNGITLVNGLIGEYDPRCLIDAPNAKSVHHLHKSVYGLELGTGSVTRSRNLSNRRVHYHRHRIKELKCTIC